MSRRHDLASRLLAVRRPSASALLASLALFFALSGSVVAATKIAKNSITSSEIKNGTIRGGDIAKDSISGGQVDERSLGVVPRAAAAGTATTAQAASQAQNAATATRAQSSAFADRAASADQLDGKDAKDFAAATEVFPVAVSLGAGETQTLVDRDGLRFLARCTTGVTTTSGGTADVLTILVEAAADGASLTSPKNSFDGSAGNTLGPATSESRRMVLQATANSGVKVVRAPSDPVSATSAGGTSIFLGAGGVIRIAFNSYGSVCAVSAPVMVAPLR